jgi:hypothetical protein
MHGLTLFLHATTWAVWLGASLVFMVFGPAAKKLPLASWAHTWITLAKVQRVLVAPSAAIATVTGILLTMALVKSQFDMGSATWLMVMQGVGLVAAILTIVFATPLVNRMARLAERSLEKGQMDPAAERVRKALALTSSIAGVMILVAVYFGVAKGS